VVAVSLKIPGTDPVQLMRFYDRVRPPGFGQATARGIELDPRDARRKLGRGLLAIGACAITVFGWLIGTGQLLLQQGSLPLNLLLLALGVAAVPWWLRALRD